MWNYIRGMLQNLGQIKLARLETMLKTFSSFNPQLKIDSASLIELLRIDLCKHLWFCQYGSIVRCGVGSLICVGGYKPMKSSKEKEGLIISEDGNYKLRRQ